MDTAGADAMDPAALHAALARFDAACAKVEGALEELGGGPSGDAYKRACTTGVRAFMDVKEASRKSYLEISKIQAVVGERRKVLDDQHLQLQNFQYREFRLSEEVKLCREFTCGQLERIEADEGASMARFLGGGAVDGAEHAERLGLLQAELEARRRLLAEREGLETTRATMEADGKRRRAFLRDLPERLKAVKDASRPLLPLLEQRGRKRRPGDDLLGRLPRPLALIHGQLAGLIAAGALDAGGSLEVEGAGDDDDAAGPADDYGGVRVAASPGAVVVDVDGVRVAFRTVPALADLVVVTPADESLVDLFPGDAGDDVGAEACAQAALGIGVRPGAPFPFAALGRPFAWAQWLGGLAPGPLAPGKLAPSSRLVVARLRARAAAAKALDAQLAALAKRPCPTALPCYDDAWRAKIAPSKAAVPPAELRSWAPYAPDRDPFASSAAAALEDAPPHRSYYKATFVHAPSKAAFAATVELSPEYPFRAPRWLLQRRDGGDAAPHDPRLKDAERELNARYDDLVDFEDASRGHLLAHQLCRLANMLAVLGGGDGDGPTFGRTHRGRDRKKPLAYDPRARANAHRVD